MINFIKTILVAGALTLTSTAMALPSITGQVNIGATSTVLTDADGNATGIDFTSLGSITTAPGITPTGDFLPLANTTGVALTDFMFGSLPVANLWSITKDGITYSFDLAAMTLTDPDPATLGIRGSGTVKITGYAATAGTWIYTQTGLSFSSETVPAPAIALLLGLGLVGIGLTRKFHKA